MFITSKKVENLITPCARKSFPTHQEIDQFLDSNLEKKRQNKL